MFNSDMKNKVLIQRCLYWLKVIQGFFFKSSFIFSSTPLKKNNVFIRKAYIKITLKEQIAYLRHISNLFQV